ncbi:MAG: DUF2007 domain-containing protein [Chlorobi bacterium]|nr:DUF2007 domain-containing protein [Chlorobiota bacterium]
MSPDTNTQPGWVKIWECRDTHQSYLLKAFLESRGIPVVLQGIEETNLFPAMGFTRIPVWVPAERAEQAKRAVDEFFKPSGE